MALNPFSCFQRVLARLPVGSEQSRHGTKAAYIVDQKGIQVPDSGDFTGWLQVFGNEQRRVGVIAGEASSTRLPIGETQATDVPREHGFSVFPDGCLARDTNEPNI